MYFQTVLEAISNFSSAPSELAASHHSVSSSMSLIQLCSGLHSKRITELTGVSPSTTYMNRSWSERKVANQISYINNVLRKLPIYAMSVLPIYDSQVIKPHLRNKCKIDSLP